MSLQIIEHIYVSCFKISNQLIPSFLSLHCLFLFSDFSPDYGSPIFFHISSDF